MWEKNCKPHKLCSAEAGKWQSIDHDTNYYAIRSDLLHEINKNVRFMKLIIILGIKFIKFKPKSKTLSKFNENVRKLVFIEFT